MNTFFQTETAIAIVGPAGTLQARAVAGADQGPLAGRNLAAVVCHPHPLHGGTMNNKVVTTLFRTCRDLGLPTVRFNFRGVEGSAGEHDDARGEVDDLLAVVDWLRGELPGRELLLAGFSFGSSVAAQAVYRCEGVRHLLLVAPPVERYPYDRERRFPCPVTVVQGGEDDVVAAPGVHRWVETLVSPVNLLKFPEAGHFFHGGLTELKERVTAELLEQLAGG